MKILAAQGEIEHADNSGINGCRMLYFECRRDHSGRVLEPKNVDQPYCIASLGGCDGMRQAIETSRTERQALMKAPPVVRSEEHTSELQSLMRISYAVFCLKKNKHSNLQ